MKIALLVHEKYTMYNNTILVEQPASTMYNNTILVEQPASNDDKHHFVLAPDFSSKPKEVPWSVNLIYA